MFNLAENLVGFQGKNPAHGIKKFTEKSRDRFLSKEEIGRFLEALEREPSDTIRDFFMVALLTGTRKQEILNMRWADIDFKEGTWNLTDPIKSRDPQKVILSGPVIEILQLREDKNPNGLPWVFPGKSGTDRLKDPRRGWVRILNRAGLENLRIHDLRRTFGSWQAITGASLLIIGKSLNHRNQSTTQIYARLNLDPVRESVEKATEAMLSKKSKPK
jgi:integrase